MKNRIGVSFLVGLGILLLIPITTTQEQVEVVSIVGVNELVEAYVSGNQYQATLAKVEEQSVSMVGKIIIADTDSYINVRTGPGIENSVVGLMSQGNGGQIIEEVNDWYGIVSGAVTGYVLKTYFHEASQEESQGFSVGITIEEYNQQVVVTAEPTQPAIVAATPEVYIDSSSNAALRDSLVNYAIQFQGIPYEYGGTTMSGLDCSGFTMLVYSQFGQSLPHSSGGQSGCGVYISPTEEYLLPGDILYRSGHVALYIGNGQIIHASNSASQIIVTSMSCMSWSGAARIIN